MNELISRLSSFLSRKVYFGSIGLLGYAYIPVWFKKHEISDNLTMASLAGLTIIVGYYFKVNVSAKLVEDGNS
jgi:hypothetical protein